VPDQSPHQELSESLRTSIAAWGSLPSGFSVERVYAATKYVGGWSDSAPGRILTLVSSVESERTAGVNDDDVSVSVVYLQKLTGETNTIIDAADKNADLLRTFLMTSALRKIAINSNAQAATRINTTLPTPYAAELIRESNVFAAVIQTTYRISRVNT
jgi:hypothetical protein